MPNPGSGSMRSSTKRDVSASSTSTTGVSTPVTSPKRAIARCSRSMNASCGPSLTGVQSSGTSASLPKHPFAVRDAVDPVDDGGVVLAAAVDRVAPAVAGEDHVATARALNEVASTPAVDDVVAGAAVEIVRACAPVEVVGPGQAADVVVAGRAHERVGATRARKGARQHDRLHRHRVVPLGR